MLKHKTHVYVYTLPTFLLLCVFLLIFRNSFTLASPQLQESQARSVTQLREILSYSLLNKTKTAQEDTSLLKTFCQPKNPCQNKGKCVETEGNYDNSFCECSQGWNGQFCEIPDVDLVCGFDKITVKIHVNMLAGEEAISFNRTELEEQDIRFGANDEYDDDENCQAINQKNSDIFTLTINSPFNQNCGTTPSRSLGNSGDYIFKNSIIWQRNHHFINNTIEDDQIMNKIKLIDFSCVYEDEYLLHQVPFDPAEVVVEQTLEKGLFHVGMTLWKDQAGMENWNLTSLYSNSPTISQESEVCVMLDLTNNLGKVNQNSEDDHLVLTATNCWASSTKHPNETSKHYIIKHKCNSNTDPTSNLIKNGEDNSVQFCFKVFEWEHATGMSDFYVQCSMAVCDENILIDGVSQCVCPPEVNLKLAMGGIGGGDGDAMGMDVIDDWIYPNYYSSDYGLSDYNYRDDYEGFYRDQETSERPNDPAHKYVNKMSKIVKDITELFGRRRKKRSVTNKFPKNGQNIKTDPKSDLIDISFGPISIRNLGDQSKVRGDEDKNSAHSNFEKINYVKIDADDQTTKMRKNTIIIIFGVCFIGAIVLLLIILVVYFRDSYFRFSMTFFLF